MENRKKPRYQHKLNMLEPGIIICKSIGLLLVAAFVFYLFHSYQIALYTLYFAGAIFLIMLGLIIIEQHQDHMMYLDAKAEDPDIK